MGLLSRLGRNLADILTGENIRRFYHDYNEAANTYQEAPQIQPRRNTKLLKKRDKISDHLMFVGIPAVVEIAGLSYYCGLYSVPNDDGAVMPFLLLVAEGLRASGILAIRLHRHYLHKWDVSRKRLCDELYQTDLFRNRIVHLLDAENGISHSTGRHAVYPPGMPPLQPASDEVGSEDSNWEKEGEEWKEGTEYQN